MRVQDAAATASATAISAGPPMAFPKPPTNAGPKAPAIVEAANPPQFQAENAVVIAFPRHIVMYLTSLFSSLSESLVRCNAQIDIT